MNSYAPPLFPGVEIDDTGMMQVMYAIAHEEENDEHDGKRRRTVAPVLPSLRTADEAAGVLGGLNDFLQRQQQRCINAETDLRACEQEREEARHAIKRAQEDAAHARQQATILEDKLHEERQLSRMRDAERDALEAHCSEYAHAYNQAKATVTAERAKASAEVKTHVAREAMLLAELDTAKAELDGLKARTLRLEKAVEAAGKMCGLCLSEPLHDQAWPCCQQHSCLQCMERVSLCPYCRAPAQRPEAGTQHVMLALPQRLQQQDEAQQQA